jgi:putative addiction module component (TIGR02574 family)
MAVTVEQLTNDALTLSEAERAHLAHNLLLSLGPEPEEDVEAAWEAKIARRVEEIRSGKVEGIPAEDVFRDLSARFEK